MILTPQGVVALAAAVTGCPAPTQVPAPPADRPTYEMSISIGAAKKLVRGTSRVSFALDRASDRIVFRLWPNMPVQRRVGAGLEVGNVRVDGATVPASSPDPTTLLLARPIGAGERVTVTMTWTLRLPRTPTERLASATGVRLGSFFPLFAWSGTEWALDPPAPQLETWTSPVADFDVRVTAPKGMRVFASGANRGKGLWHAVAVRDFALQAGRFTVARRTVHVPLPVVRLLNGVAGEAATETPPAVRNRLGEPMTFWGPLPFMPTVWDGLYLQGVNALASLGDDDGVDCALQRYVHDNAYRVAQPRDLLAALAQTFPNTETVLTGFGADFSR